MKKQTSGLSFMLCSIFLILPVASTSASEITEMLLHEYQQGATKPISTESGEELWRQVVNGRSCTNCHTLSPRNQGKHIKTKKLIEPMSPSVNHLRFTDEKKVRKWFFRNCKWTFGRECTPEEKGSILFWLSQQ